MKNNQKGQLYIVATPIGNLGDITIRALEILKKVDLIACEDTRQTIKILERFEINKPQISYFQHSKISKVEKIISELKAGKNIALVTDAGTPGISDPGNKLIAEAVANEIYVVPIPGPCAVIAALSISGFPTDKFLFLGFMPHKGKNKIFKQIQESKITIVFYESVHRIIKTLEQLREFLKAERQILVGRELTKKFESVYRGNIDEIIGQFQANIKGEYVVVIKGKNK